MTDPRLQKLADLLLDHSCRIQPGERVLIEAFDLPDAALVNLLIAGAAQRGAVPLVSTKQNAVLRELYRMATDESARLAGDVELYRMKQVQAYIGVRGAANTSEFADVPAPKMELYQKHVWQPVHLAQRVPKTKWVVLRYPTASMAQSAGMSTEAFEDFYFRVCTADYAAMARAQEPLARRMQSADRVRITGPGTEVEFSIRGIPVRPCHGQRNIPDGEVFTAPVRDSLEGVIRFNTPSLYQGATFENVRLVFERGKVVRAEAGDQTGRLNAILDSDEGARCVGEWALGCNPHVTRPMKDTLFDEKIGGSTHFALGNSYEDADNGNRSGVHWDLVLIQTPEHGGGEVHFDGELIRKDGRFVPEDLKPLDTL